MINLDEYFEYKIGEIMMIIFNIRCLTLDKMNNYLVHTAMIIIMNLLG